MTTLSQKCSRRQYRRTRGSDVGKYRGEEMAVVLLATGLAPEREARNPERADSGNNSNDFKKIVVKSCRESFAERGDRAGEDRHRRGHEEAPFAAAPCELTDRVLDRRVARAEPSGGDPSGDE